MRRVFPAASGVSRWSKPVSVSSLLRTLWQQGCDVFTTRYSALIRFESFISIWSMAVSAADITQPHYGVLTAFEGTRLLRIFVVTTDGDYPLREGLDCHCAMRRIVLYYSNNRQWVSHSAILLGGLA
jgi:hypothetical protein